MLTIAQRTVYHSSIDNSSIFGEPLLGFIDEYDPIFNIFKDNDVIGPFHFTPKEILNKALGVEHYSENISVISWILPIKEDM